MQGKEKRARHGPNRVAVQTRVQKGDRGRVGAKKKKTNTNNLTKMKENTNPGGKRLEKDGTTDQKTLTVGKRQPGRKKSRRGPDEQKCGKDQKKDLKATGGWGKKKRPRSRRQRKKQGVEKTDVKKRFLTLRQYLIKTRGKTLRRTTFAQEVWTGRGKEESLRGEIGGERELAAVGQICTDTMKKTGGVHRLSGNKRGS